MGVEKLKHKITIIWENQQGQAIFTAEDISDNAGKIYQVLSDILFLATEIKLKEKKDEPTR